MPLSSLADRLVCQLQAPDSSGAPGSPQDLLSSDLQLPCIWWGNTSSPLLPLVPCSKKRLHQPVQDVSKPCKFPPESGWQGQRPFSCKIPHIKTKAFQRKWSNGTTSLVHQLSPCLLQRLHEGSSTLEASITEWPKPSCHSSPYFRRTCPWKLPVISDLQVPCLAKQRGIFVLPYMGN